MTVLAACGQMNLSFSGSGESGMDEDPGVPTSDLSSTAATTGAGGTSEQSVIEIYPEDSDANPSAPYASLCGPGSCVIGEDASCGTSGNGEFEACQLVPGEETAVAECGPIGGFQAEEPCNDADDCAAGLGCVKEPSGGGVCKPYCCGDAEQCPAKTFCDLQPMAEVTDNGTRQVIPVCVTATTCDPFNDKNACPSGLACTIVRASGLTSCVKPGPNELNGPCPCAAGLVCAKLTNECKKLCRIGQDDVDCGPGATCQGGSQGYPPSIGICISGS